MTKRLLLFVCFIFLAFFSYSQKGWRQDEMEIRIHLKSVEEGIMLRSLSINVESASTDGSLLYGYVIPTERVKLDQAGIQYDILIPNLFEHYRNFWSSQLVPQGYYTYEQIVAIADSLSTNFPSICKKVIYGASIDGRQLGVLKISDNVNADENEPEVLFDGGIHGDEVGGPQNLIMFARDLCKGYNHDSLITNLIKTREIWLYYMVNPDGRVNMSRFNENFVDCNRDAGYMWDANGNSTSAYSQVETQALRNCMWDHRPVVYINYHSGNEMICYPWSYRESATPDNPHLNQMAWVYSSTSGYPFLIYGQGYTILYPINGSFKDADFGTFGSIGWTIEISNDKQPLGNLIQQYYNYNKPAMLETIKRAGYGIEGVVTDSITGNPIAATIWVNNFFPVYNDPIVGDYHKYILPNLYTVRVTANGYKSQTLYFVNVPNTGSAVVNFQMVPEDNHFAYRVLSCQIPGNNFADPANTPGVLGPPDNSAYALGHNGWINIDMGDTVYNHPGADLKVYEAGGAHKGYYCYAGATKDGPWQQIGTGTGTDTFDLSSCGLTKARYFQIKDGGNGASTGLGAGFNLDAIEMICNGNVNLGNDTTILAGDSITLDAGNPGSSYLWSTGETTQTIKADSSGTGYGSRNYSVKVNNTPSCSSSDDIVVTFTYPDGMNGVDDSSPVSVYPNPFNDLLHLTATGISGGKYRLFSQQGKMILDQPINTHNLKEVIDIGNLPSGIYLIEVFNSEKNIIKKIIKE